MKKTKIFIFSEKIKMEKIVEEYSKKLEKLGIEHSFVKHPPLKEVADIMRHLGLPLSDGFSTLVMKADDQYVVVIRRDDCRLDYKKIKKILHASNLRIAEEAEFEKMTGLKSGAAHVLIPNFKIFLDKRLFEKEYLLGGCGTFEYSCRYKTTDLQKIPNSQVDSLTQEGGIIASEISQTGTILTGITPSGSGHAHIGNYSGAVEQFIKLQQKAQKAYFFIADLHALTTIQNKEELQRNVESQVLNYLALGIDPEKVIFYRQSDIPTHTELQSILNNVTPLGLIKRCHAYKDKLQKNEDEENINMGLFSYPVLMAADILLYDVDYVPVGDDQKQHIEITRDVADYFNKKFGETFKLPKGHLTKILVGTEGQRKMSKGLGNVINIFEDEAIIKKQVMNCFTDPTRKTATDPGHVEGNPVFMYHDLINDNKEEVKDLKERYQKGTVGDVEVKEKLYAALMKKFQKERARYEELKKNPDKIKKILAEGAAKARSQATKKMMEVREKIGITNKYSSFSY